ncbi:unnamed protein product [Mytilus edulis]|uniref:C2H2-type domain-containing protein n=1 Tax=Mytilus edulis TaxID=6550 RepID=A0A8S3RYN9_MYTED|nr:unnamed protein product [Mytilus edulis]
MSQEDRPSNCTSSPSVVGKIDQIQWDCLYHQDTTSKKCNIYGPGCACIYYAKPGLSESHIDKGLSSVIHRNLCELRRAVDKISSLRNDLAHSTSFQLSRVEFDSIWNEATTYIRSIASYIGKEPDVIAIIETVLFRPLEDGAYKKLLASILEFEIYNKRLQRVEMREVKSSLSTIGEKHEEQLLKVTETLQKMDETQQEMRNEMKAQITEELTIVFKAEMEDFIGKINDTIKENKEQLSTYVIFQGLILAKTHSLKKTSLVKKKQEKFIKGIEEEGINDHPDDKFQCGSCKENVCGGLLKIIEHRKNCTARVDKRDLESDDLEGDVYQCGICEDKFTRLRSFMNHKKDKCSRKPKLVSEMSFRNKLMEGLPEEEFSRVTKERKDKGKIADTFRKTKYLPKDQSSSDSDSENDMVPNTTGAMNYFQQSCQLSKEYKNKEFFHSHAIQHGLKLSKRCVARLQNECARKTKEKRIFIWSSKNHKNCCLLLQRYPMKYKQGILQIDSSHGAICKIKNATDGIDLIVISGRSKCGKAYTDDEVVVEVLLENSEIP